MITESNRDQGGFADALRLALAAIGSAVAFPLGLAYAWHQRWLSPLVSAVLAIALCTLSASLYVLMNRATSEPPIWLAVGPANLLAVTQTLRMGLVAIDAKHFRFLLLAATWLGDAFISLAIGYAVFKAETSSFWAITVMASIGTHLVVGTRAVASRLCP